MRSRRRRSLLNGLVSLLLLLTMLPPTVPTVSAQRERPEPNGGQETPLPGNFSVLATRNFDIRYQTNTTGDVVFVSNTVMTCPGPGATCTNGRNGTGTSTNNNNFTMTYVDVDSDGTTFNSSRANLSLPAGATILFAGLYWGGDSTAGNSGAAAPDTANRDQVRLATPASANAYTTITASQLDFETSAGNDYQGFADITSTVKAAGNGTYTVANIQVGTGQDRQGGWSIVVAYTQPDLPTRNITVYDGFAIVNNVTPNISIPVSDFLTPPSGPVNTKLGIIAYEGDRASTGDSLRLNGVTLSDSTHPSNNFFTSVISNLGNNVTSKNPNYINQFGYDASIVNANGILTNNATSATISLTTGSEFYQPGVVSFVTDLYAPRIEPVKSVVDLNGGPARPGDVLEYTVVVTNSGQDDATKVVLSDPIPANTTYVPGSLQITAGANSGTKTDAAGDDQAFFDSGANQVVFNLGTGATSAEGGFLAASGGTTTVKFRVRINASAPNGADITNQAVVNLVGPTLGQPIAANSNVPSVPVVNQADLSVTKTDNSSTATPGGTVTYTIVGTNSGPSAVTGATIADTFPAALTGVTWRCTGAGGAICPAPGLGTGNISALVDLPVNGTVTFTATGTLSPTTTVALNNTVTIAPPTGVGDPDPSNNSVTDADNLNAVADLHIIKTDGNTSAVPGSPITYTIVATNLGPSVVTNATVTDTFPAALTNSTWTCVASGGSSCGAANGSGNIDTQVTLAVNGMATFTATATVAGGATGTLANTASIRAPANVSDPTPANNSATDTNTLTPRADLSITKTDNAASSTPGAPVSYTLVVSNAGPSDVSGASVADTFGASLVNVNWTCTATAGSSCAAGSGSGNIATAVSLLSGGSATFTIAGTVSGSASGTVANTATVTPPSGVTDPNPGNNTATDTNTVVDVPRIGLAKLDGAVADNGDGTFTVPYLFTLRNYGNTPLTNVQITDNLATTFAGASGFTVVAGSLSATGGLTTNAAYNGSSVTSLLAPGNTLAVGATATVSFRVRVAPGPVQGPFSNSATASGTSPSNTPTTDLSDDGTDPDPNNDGNPNQPGENDPTQIIFAPSADVSVTKSNTPQTLPVGGNVSYLLTVRNAGPSGATGVVVTDPLPAGVTLVSTTPSQGSCTSPGGVPTCALGTLSSGSTATVTIVVTTTTVGTLTNSASVTANEPDPDMTNNGANSGTGVAASADLSIVKTDTADPISAGQNVTYTVVVTNNGPSPATGVQAVDLLPAGATYVSATPSQGNCSGTSTVSCTVGSLASGGSATITLVATATSAGVLTNAATVRGNESDPNPANNGATQSTTVTASADLAITKTDAPDPVSAGQNVTYTIVVTNNGPSPATGVQAVDLMPAGASFVSVSATQGRCIGTGTVNCEIGALANGGSATITLVATADQGGVLTNQARVSGSQPDPNPANNGATATTTVNAQADITVAKSASPAALVVGSDSTFLVTVTNNGPSTATGIVVTDVIPVGMTLVSSAPSQGTPCAGSTTVTCALGTLANGGSATVTIVARATTSGSFVNLATAQAAEPDPNNDNNGASATVVATRSADLSVTKSASPAAVNVGEQITYTITATNSGPSDSTGVVALDLLPANVSYSSVTPSQGSCIHAAAVSCTLGNLSANSSATITLVVDAIASGVIVNTAVVTGDEPDPDPSNNSVSTGTTGNGIVVTPAADLLISKTPQSSTVTVGQDVTYVLSVTNAGPDQATAVTVVDTLPASLNFVSATPSNAAVCAFTTVITCALGMVAVDETVTIILVTTANASGTIANSAAVSGADFDPLVTNNGATAGIVASASADLSITKTAAPDPVILGSQVTYTLTVNNAGPSIATNVNVTDPLPEGMSLQSATPSVGGSCAGTTTVTCNFPSIANAGTAAVTIVATATTGGTKVNTATVSSDTPDPNAGNNAATAGVAVTANADVSITKTASASAVSVGSNVTYTLTARNNGPAPASSVVVTDNLPEGATLVSATPAQGGPCTGTTTIVCPLGSLVNGADTTVSIVATLTTSGSLVNLASVSAREADPTPSNNGASAGVTVSGSADLSITKSGTPSTATVGGTITYTLTAQNSGPSTASGVVVRDIVPNGATLVSATASRGTCTGAPEAVCAIGSLANGASATVTVVVRADSAGTLVNSASIAGLEPDPVNANNGAVAGTVVLGTTPATNADLAITKEVELGAVALNDQVTFTIVVRNNGPSDATNVVVTDPLPSRLTLVSATPTRGTCSGTSTVTCQIGSLANGARATITLVTRTTADGGVTNNASVRGDQPDATVDNNGATASLIVGQLNSPPADLTVTKAGDDAVAYGDNITYTITVRNAGPGLASDVRVTDPLPAGVALVSATPSQGACSGTTTVTCSLGALQSGASATVRLVVSASAEGRIVNRVTVVANEFDPNAANNADSQATTIGPRTRQEPSEDDPKKPTEEQRQQNERTNRSGLDDYRTEGNVVAKDCGEGPEPGLPATATQAEPPFIVIANRDGLVTIRLLGDSRYACKQYQVGDYLEADGEKVHEYLFDAENVSKPRRR
ncbi:MAG: DUF11 domain-containing protein [Chloroflexi bacterium]|nr:DUF11 domain-containing protein [Chloroflexota bacterium]